MSLRSAPTADGAAAADRVAFPPSRVKNTRGVVNRRTIAIFIAPFGILFLVFFAAPILYATWKSLYVVQRTGTYGPATQVFGGLSQYVQVFQDATFWESVGRVLLFGVVQVPIMIGLALLFALLLDSPLLRGKRFFRLAFFAPYAVPGVIAAIMWGYLFSPTVSPFSVLTSKVDFLSGDLVLWAIVNVVTWVFVGYNMLIIYSSLLAIPAEIYEAARLDGAGQLRIAWSVKIPMVMPALVLTVVFSIIGTLQLLAEPQVFTQFTSTVTSTYTPNLVVYATASVPNFNFAAAFSVVLALATFVLSFGFLRFTRRKALSA
ncbi:carbohydrate ABC transporter permease [Nonomuraea sp. NPDC002799]